MEKLQILSLTLLAGMQNGTTNLEYLVTVWGFLFCFKLHVNLYDPMIQFLEIYPREKWSHVHSKICTWMFTIKLIILALKETIQMAINQRIDKQIVLYVFNRILFSPKNERTTDRCYNMDESNFKNVMLHKRSWIQRTTK